MMLGRDRCPGVPTSDLYLLCVCLCVCVQGLLLGIGPVTTRNVATPGNVANTTLPENVANFVGGYIFREPHTTAFLYTAGRVFKYDVIFSQVAGYNSNKQNDPIDDAFRGRHALASLPAGI